MRLSSFGFLIPATGTNTQFLLASTNRVRIVLFSVVGAANDVWVSPNPMTGARQGIVVTPATGQIVLDADLDGEIVQNAWFIFTSTSNDGIAWVEVMDG